MKVIAPTVVAELVGRYLSDEDVSVQRRAIDFVRRYFGEMWYRAYEYRLREEPCGFTNEEQQTAQRLLLTPLTVLVHTQLDAHGADLIKTVGVACEKHAVPLLKECLSRPGGELPAAMALARIGDASGREILKRALDDEDFDIRHEAAQLLHGLGSSEGLRTTLNNMMIARDRVRKGREGPWDLEYDNWVGRFEQCVSLLGYMRNEAAVPALLDLLAGSRYEAGLACTALAFIAGDKYLQNPAYSVSHTPQETVSMNWRAWWDNRKAEPGES
jgi:hypothetical protein